MSNKKISEFEGASYIDYENDYVLIARNNMNNKLRVGAIIEETVAALPTKLSQFKNDVGYLAEIPSEYITDTELTLKGYLTEKDAIAYYAKKSDVPDRVGELENDMEYVTEDELTIRDYATKAFVRAEVLNAKLETEGPEINLNNYATINYVDDQIDKIELTPGPKGDKGDRGDRGDTGSQGPTGPKGADGLTTSIKLNNSTYNHSNGVITLPNYPTVPSKVSSFTNDSNYATESFVTQKISEAALGGTEIELNYSTASPKSPGTASAGTANTISRGDHVHPAQTSVTGNAGTATKLQTARSINGTDFDGSGNITTSNWGTSRNLTIGNKTQSVNGSGNVTWSLSDIGAAASSHTHSGYAASSHTHDYAASNHSHNYASSSHSHNEYSLTSHSHNYAATGHTHSDYSLTSHTHNYAASTHTHTEYASSGHSHSGYASSSHSHSEYLKLAGGTLTGTLTARAINPAANNTYEIGTESMKWHYVNTNGVSTTSDRSAKENINYIRNNESEVRVLDDGVDEAKAPDITYIDLYEFVKDDLELATYNLKDVPKYRLNINFIAQDLLYNTDQTDNVVGQIIVPPIVAPTDEEAELYGTLDENGSVINAPTLSYDTGNYISVLAGALKQAINEIESLKELVDKQQEIIDQLLETK